METESIAGSRSKRQKLDKHGRFAALERLKSLKGNKNKCVINDVDNVYEEVDEREYSKRVLARQEDDWIVDDGDGGYVEDGREIFDDDVTEDNAADVSRRKSKGNKKQVAAKPKTSGGNIQSLLANMPTKKKVAQSNVNADELLDSLMGEIENEEASVKTPTISSKEYLKSFTSRSTISRTSNDMQKLKPFLDTPRPVPAVKRRKSPSPPPVPVRRALISEYSDPDTGLGMESGDSVPEPLDLPPAINNALEPSSNKQNDQFPDSDDFANIVDDFSEPMTLEETPKSAIVQAVQAADDLSEVGAWFIDDWEAPSSSTSKSSASVEIDKNAIPLVTNESGEQVFRFFWWDAYEDPFNQPGNVYLFGKVHVETVKEFVSCCVVVSNIPRKVFLLPREKKFNSTTNSETHEPVTFIDVFKEFNDKVANSRKIMKHKSRKVVKKYAFDLPDVPAESEYLEVKYPANFDRLPADLKGETFSRIFGTNTSALEIFLLEQKIKGPCWLDVRGAVKGQAVSWCQMDVSCGSPELVTVSAKVAPPPPMSVLALNVRTVLNSRTMQNEVIMVSFLTQSKFMVDKAAPSPPFEQGLCAFTRPSDVVWPVSLQNEIAQFRGKLIKHESERSLLSYVLTKIFQLDPDLIVGHDLYGFTLDTVIHRVEQHKVANWSRIGRLRRAGLPQKKGKMGDRYLLSGRLVCDTMRSARELIRARSYDLDSLSKQVLKLPEGKRQDFTMEETKNMFGNSKNVLTLVNATMQDTICALRLMYDLNVMPLALQITNIAGNLMSGTLLGGRSERNEFLLLHAFTDKEFIVPDKSYGKKKLTEMGEQTNEPSNRKKPEYAGGLVLEPKRGFYDKYILLMDFNSLYPSIIQEYNICFTTVARTTDADQEPDLPANGVPLGILPIEIRKLVESRRQVKSMMKSPDLSVDVRMQYNIRQTALKLTANSMYGCLGFSHSRFYAKPLAALVTSRGREILMNTRDVVQRMNYDVIYGDTDSIMINTNCVDFEQVFSIGGKIKVEINKLYRNIELEVDGVFKYMLLLKKKKYAAVVLSKSPSGELVATQEYKGLDIVRRDWSRLSAEIGEFVLQQILSESGPDDRVEAIRSHLEKVATDLRNRVVPIELLAITKQLAKNPEDYPDRKSLPHLQVAMRVNSKGGKKLKAGDTVSYVICDDGTNESAVQRAYHIDELKGNDKLIIDVHYYLSSQIHPVVSRLCEPIDGLDSAFIAECLGLDPTSYRRAAARINAEAGDDEDGCVVDDMQYFRHCDKFTFTCPNEDCKTAIVMEAPVHDNYLVLSRCRNPACNVAPFQYLPRIQNTLQLSIRSYTIKLYENWMICEDPACTNRTRRIPMEFANSYPVCRLCKRGLMYREYQNSDLYYQLKFFSYIFNLKQSKLQASPNIETAYKKLHEQVEQILNQSAYRIIDLSKIFKFSLTNARPNLSASQRTLFDVHSKLSSL